MADLQISSKLQEIATVADGVVAPTSMEEAAEGSTEAGATETGRAKLSSSSDEESWDSGVKVPLSTDQSSESSQSTLDSDESRSLSLAQGAREPLRSAIIAQDIQVTVTYKLVGQLQNGTETVGPVTQY